MTLKDAAMNRLLSGVLSCVGEHGKRVCSGPMIHSKIEDKEIWYILMGSSKGFPMMFLIGNPVVQSSTCQNHTGIPVAFVSRGSSLCIESKVLSNYFS